MSAENLAGWRFRKKQKSFDQECPHKLRREQLTAPGERALPADGWGTAWCGVLDQENSYVSWSEQLVASGRWALPTDKRRSSVFGLSDRGPVLPPMRAARSTGKMGPASRWTRSNVIWEARSGGLTPLLWWEQLTASDGWALLVDDGVDGLESTDREGPRSFDRSSSRRLMGGPYWPMDG